MKKGWNSASSRATLYKVLSLEEGRGKCSITLTLPVKKFQVRGRETTASTVTQEQVIHIYNDVTLQVHSSALQPSVSEAPFTR